MICGFGKGFQADAALTAGVGTPIGSGVGWSVIATFAGVLVAAIGAAWAIVREQSVLRQLERVSSILKDYPESDAGREDLEFVRGDLAKRLNKVYRAPYEWFAGFAGWVIGMFGAAALIMAYLFLVTAANQEWPTSHKHRQPADWVNLASFTGVLGAVAVVVSIAFFARRTSVRRKWLKQNAKDMTSREDL